MIPFLALATVAVAAQESPRFTIKQYRVEGNTVLPEARIQAVLAPYTGEQRDFADVQHALEALENLYRQAGFGALQVYLPEQELKQGVVEIKVIEPRLGQVRIEGNQYFGENNVRHALPALQPGSVPNTGRMADNLRLANESPSRRLAVTLQAAQAPQTVDAVVKVTDEKPWRAFSSLDNSGSEETGQTRLSLGVQHANLFDRDHVFTAQFTTSPEKPDKVRIFGLGYKLPLYDAGDSLSFFAGYSSVESGALQGLFNVSGKGKVAGGRYNQALSTLGAYQQKLAWGLDWRRFDTDTAFAGSQLPASSYTLRPVSLAYQAQWQDSRWSTDWNASLAHNLPTGEDLARVSGRTVAKDRYTVARLGGNVYYSLPVDWMTHLSLNAQLTSDALPPAEQFGLGGANTLRGYGERVLADDEGVLGSLEAYSPDVAQGLVGGDWLLRGVAFVDWGHISRNRALPGEQSSTSLAGAGLGLRLGWGKRASLKLDVAQALKDGGGESKHDTRVHFSATVSY
ncbi:ShlB/FhaC/HecB family hemolysin secretion/activation protein [Chitinimonas naiadis]